MSLARRESTWGLLFLAPWILGFILFFAGPMLASLGASFTDLVLVRPGDAHFVGVDNWTRLVGDPLVLKSLLVTANFLLIALPITLALPLLMAASVEHATPAGEADVPSAVLSAGADSRRGDRRHLAGRPERPDGLGGHGAARARPPRSGLAESAAMGDSGAGADRNVERRQRDDHHARRTPERTDRAVRRGESRRCELVLSLLPDQPADDLARHLLHFWCWRRSPRSSTS